MFKDGEAIGERHVEVGDDEGGIGVFSAVSVFAFAHHVGNGFEAIAEEVDWGGNTNGPEGRLNEDPVVGAWRAANKRTDGAVSGIFFCSGLSRLRAKFSKIPAGMGKEVAFAVAVVAHRSRGAIKRGWKG